MYINLKTSTIVTLTGFEVAALANEILRNDGEETLREDEIDLAIDYAVQSGIAWPLRNDQFRDWSIDASDSRRIYSVEDIVSERQMLYYMPIGGEYYEYLNARVLSMMFAPDWIRARTYTLRFTTDV